MLAEHAGIDKSDYRRRAADIRRDNEEEAQRRMAEAKQAPRDTSNEACRLYESLLRRMRDHQPLVTAAIDDAPRSILPM